jgi:hypothetical protein
MYRGQTFRLSWAVAHVEQVSGLAGRLGRSRRGYGDGSSFFAVERNQTTRPLFELSGFAPDICDIRKMFVPR